MIAETDGDARGIERLYLDFDSFFASAEQHFNPSLRGKPLGVVPLDSPNTSCIAVSREAKARGVKSGCSIKAARQVIPDMIFVIARHDVYVRLHKRILTVVDAILPVGKVRSIDELVCNLLPEEAEQGAALSATIKSALAEAFSPQLTCSIGMAPTELLAKIGAEMNKPDGFALIHSTDLPDKLADMEITDLPGISKGIEARLAAAGVADFTALWSLAPKQARAIWGNVEGERFWNGLHGYHSERPATKKSMYGHSRNLPQGWRTPERVAACARQLTLSAARRLRREGGRATRLTVSLSGEGPRGRGARDGGWSWESVFPPARDDRTFLRALAEGLAQAGQSARFAPRSVSVVIHGLKDETELTGDLFGGSVDPHGAGENDATRAKWEKVSELLDDLRRSHGAKAISYGLQEDMPGGYIGAKIAFGRIPDEEDFSETPVADEQTRFLSY
ncbi:DNA polymerase-4 [Sagittula marina]|uniref:DNA-directed DNA polymerase n=1 Tax=Sagittula marina TaxID=943940 RepID=A0A7W6DT15_9RHOB|nr:DNA polymerase-4 [Sagittula marina]